MKLYKLAVFILIAFISNNAFAFASKTTYGIGIGSTALFGEGIAFPINSGHLFIEPSIFLNTYHSSIRNLPTEFYNDESLDLGLGIFKKSKVENKTFIYYGARIGYQNSKHITESTISKNYDTAHGPYVAPTLGAEYFLSAKFTLGLDVSLRYSKLNVKNSNISDTATTVTTGTSTEYDTYSRITVRYHF